MLLTGRLVAVAVARLVRFFVFFFHFFDSARDPIQIRFHIFLCQLIGLKRRIGLDTHQSTFTIERFNLEPKVHIRRVLVSI